MSVKHYPFFHGVDENNELYNTFNSKPVFILKIILLLALCCFQNKTYAKEIIMASDIWCPYICQDPQKPGYIVEMLNDILQEKQFIVRNETIPLARAIMLLKNDKVDIVLGLTQQHIDHHQLISSTMPVGIFANDFFVKSNNAWQFTSVAELAEYASKNHNIGIIKGYFYGQSIEELIAEKPNLFSYAHGDFPLNQNINRLMSGHIDIILDSKNAVLSEVKRLNIAPLNYAGTQGKSSQLYVALSKIIDVQLLQVIDQGIIDYRNSGKLDKLLTNYGISDWQ